MHCVGTGSFRSARARASRFACSNLIPRSASLVRPASSCVSPPPHTTTQLKSAFPAVMSGKGMAPPPKHPLVLGALGFGGGGGAGGAEARQREMLERRRAELERWIWRLIGGWLRPGWGTRRLGSYRCQHPVQGRVWPAGSIGISKLGCEAAWRVVPAGCADAHFARRAGSPEIAGSPQFKSFLEFDRALARAQQQQRRKLEAQRWGGGRLCLGRDQLVVLGL